LIKEEDVIKLIQSKPLRLNLVLTGRYASKKIVELADMVSEVREIKHHYKKGIKAKPGVEF
jgi:cob(I)alamin adenosyltransferase